MGLFLGIDTSNYTTSTAVFNSETGEMLQQKKLLPVKEGQLGLRQSDAVFHHTSQLHSLYGELVKNIDMSEIEAIGVSNRPRPVEGSYMPCFLVGENTAKIISYTLKKPLITFSHQEGHISSALFSAKRDDLFDKEFIAFHISGGTTEAVLARGNGAGFKLDLIAETLDLNAGQAVDRTGLMLGLKFPCGKELEKLALKNAEKINVKTSLKGCNCCLSGVENKCRQMLEKGESKEKISAFCIEYIRKTLDEMTKRLLEKYGDKPVLFAGGVMSNSIIRKDFEKRFNAIFAEPQFSTDNSAGIAYLTYKKWLKTNI